MNSTLVFVRSQCGRAGGYGSVEGCFFIIIIMLPIWWRSGSKLRTVPPELKHGSSKILQVPGDVQHDCKSKLWMIIMMKILVRQKEKSSLLPSDKLCVCAAFTQLIKGEKKKKEKRLPCEKLVYIRPVFCQSRLFITLMNYSLLHNNQLSLDSVQMCPPSAFVW